VYSYTLLVGKPPFETPSLRETYVRITRNDYRVPSGLSAPARNLIHLLLHPDPHCRPTMEEVLRDEFLVSGKLHAYSTVYTGNAASLIGFLYSLSVKLQCSVTLINRVIEFRSKIYILLLFV